MISLRFLLLPFALLLLDSFVRFNTGRMQDIFFPSCTFHMMSDPSLAPLYAVCPSCDSATHVGVKSCPRWYVTPLASSHALAYFSADAPYSSPASNPPPPIQAWDAASIPILLAIISVRIDCTPSNTELAICVCNNPDFRRRSFAIRFPTLSTSGFFRRVVPSSSSPDSSSSSSDSDCSSSILVRYSFANRNFLASTVSSSSLSASSSSSTCLLLKLSSPSSSSSSDSTFSSRNVGVMSSSSASSYRPPC